MSHFIHRIVEGCRAARRCALVGLISAVVIALSTPPADARRISLIRDSETERLLRDYADPVLVSAGLTPSSVRIYIINDPSINAFVTAGRRMFFHTGLMLKADTPNQLIGVIAHEAGHIAGSHIARAPDAFAAAATPALISIGLGIIAVAAGAPDVGLAMILGGQHIAQRQVLTYSRVQESSADQAAVTYLDRIGQSSQGLIEFFEKFRDQELVTPGVQDPYVRTHPLSSQRIAALRGRVGESPYADREDSAESKRRMSMVQAKIHGFLDQPGVTFRRYPPSDLSDQAHYARTVAYFRRGEVEGAKRELAPLLAREPDNPFYHEMMGQILFETGQPQAALPSYRRALELLPEEGLFKLYYGQVLLATDDEGKNAAIAEEAVRYLRQASREEGENSFVWHQLAIAYSRLNKLGLADFATAERFFVSGQYARSLQFARRARLKLSPGTPEWNRLNDIMTVSEREARNSRNRRRLQIETSGSGRTGDERRPADRLIPRSSQNF